MLSVRKAQLPPLKKMVCIRHNINMVNWVVFALTKKLSQVYIKQKIDDICTYVPQSSQSVLHSEELPSLLLAS